MRTYAKRVEALTERLVLSKLPLVGSGDPLDQQALSQGLRTLELELDRLADRSRRSARAAAQRASDHGRRESQRILNVKLPVKSPLAQATVEAFADQGVASLRRAGKQQVSRMRQAIAQHAEGSSMRADILQTLWVSRNRGKTIARDQVHGVFSETIRAWSSAVGSEKFTWHTRRDERVRAGHQALDGRTFFWNAPPNTGRGEGNNLPGQPVNCRCVAIPVVDSQP